MPSRLEKKRAQNKKYYKDHKEKLSLQACQNYAANSDLKRRASKQYFETHKQQKLAYNSKYFEAHKEKIKAILNLYYTANKDKMKAYFCKYYDSHSDQRKASFNEYYDVHKDDMRVYFSHYCEVHKDDMKVYFSEYYETHKGDMKVSFREYYEAHKDDMKVSFSEYYEAHKENMTVSFSKYYEAHKDEMKVSFGEYYDAHKDEMKGYFREYYMKHKQAILKACALYYGPQSVKVNVKCLKEVNRLRQEYRTDLPLHDVSVSSAAIKRKLRALSDTNEPPAKRQHTTKEAGISVVGRQHPPPTKLQSTQVCEHYISPFKFHSVNEQWQRDACVLLGLNFEGSNAMEKGGACTPLSSPQKIKPIQGDVVIACLEHCHM